MRDREALFNDVLKAPEEEGVMSRLIKDKSAKFNIIIMIIVWVCTSLTFYMFNFFIKYMPGDIYFNSIVSSFAVGVLIFQVWLV